MVRIGGSTELGSHIHESDYYTPSGEFRIDKEGSQTLLNCLMYKLSYYKFGQLYTDSGGRNVLLKLSQKKNILKFVCLNRKASGL